jgi:hypothetical protein
MAKQKTTEEPQIEEETAAVAEPEPSSNAGPPAGDCVIIVNRERRPLDCPLRNGRYVRVGPFIPGLEIHKSEPIAKKLLTPLIQKWVRQNRLVLEPAEGGVANG